ncbi:MAG: hypothetical protein JWP47_699 [Polaromonas sp.]|nr:hypothetical protein [Polaromonas sp.]
MSCVPNSAVGTALVSAAQSANKLQACAGPRATPPPWEPCRLRQPTNSCECGPLYPGSLGRHRAALGLACQEAWVRSQVSLYPARTAQALRGRARSHQPLCVPSRCRLPPAALTSLPPSKAVRNDDPPSKTSTRPSPGDSTADSTIGLSSKHLTVDQPLKFDQSAEALEHLRQHPERVCRVMRCSSPKSQVAGRRSQVAGRRSQVADDVDR